ncbi:hypothetical protein PHISP_02925 [Aspergillus sp. HF37]|nr:hypothetical protein PHISP_02925 [Aspergillus sp. HF37]
MPTEPPSLQHDHDYDHDHNHADTHPNPPAETSQTLATTLIAKCRTLLGEINTFQTLIAQTLRNPQVVEVRSLRSSVVSELRTLEKMGTKVEDAGAGPAEAGDGSGSGTGTTPGPEPETRLLHTLRSSNLPFYETVWAVAKGSCRGITMFGKRFYWGEGEEAEGSKWKKPNKDKRKSVLVDIVADDGEEWVKVSTISESRLLFEMAKKGWEGDESEEEDGGRTVLRNTGDDGDDSDDEDEVEFIKLARDMRRAADTIRVRYRRPRIRFVIPKIEEGKAGDIDRLLKEIRSYGITVDCGGQEFDQGVYRDASELDLSHLLPNTFKRLTPTLNVDCTLLLAIVSDLSHSKDIQPSPIHHRAINRQIEIDRQQPLLPTELWPAMDARVLICTEEAAQRMHDIVNVIGTDTEKERMRIMMGSPPFEHWDAASLVQKFQGLSDYQVPGHWKLPARIVEAQSVIESARQHGKLPQVAEHVAKGLSDINYSVFLYGWSAGLTTISSNRTAVKQIELTVEKHRNGDQDLEGPPVWVCDTARSLIGKEKGRND